MPGADFIALAELLLPAAAPAPATAGADECDRETVASRDDDETGAPRGAAETGEPHGTPLGDDVGVALRDARLFRARLAEAFDDALARMLRDLAADVLVRELRLAPCDLVALIGRIVQRAPFVRLRIAAGERVRDFGLPWLVDPTLEAGDAIVELSGGALDLRLGVRLAAVLERFP